nr:TadA family conjugal transfer-associated ATPase [Gryllotalpicola sp.]
MQARLRNPGVTDVVVNGSAGLWTDSGFGLRRDTAWQLDEAGVRALAVRLIALGGRHLDEASPCVDAVLPTGERVHAVLAPVSASGTLLSIRAPSRAWSFDALVATGMPGAFERPLRAAIAERRSVLVTGAAGSGKSTLLGALLGLAPAAERLVLVEDVAELRVRHPHVVALQARQANVEGAGAIGLDRLVREALRMRPDRLVVGEVRGAEVRDLLVALNTGHSGGGTLHANSLADVPARLEALGALAGLDMPALARQAGSAIDLVVHVARTDGARRVTGLARLVAGERLEIDELAAADLRSAA